MLWDARRVPIFELTGEHVRGREGKGEVKGEKEEN